MNKEKSKNIMILILVIVVVILIVLVLLFATNTIRLNSKTNESNSQLNGTIEENSNVDDEKDVSESYNQNNETINSNWINYLLSCHILDATITRNRSIDLGDDIDLNKTVTITLDDLKTILFTLENTNLIKTYSLGRGGPDSDHLTVSYEYNEEVYKFEIYYGSIAVDNLDSGLKEILDNNHYEEKNIEYKNQSDSFYFYSIENYSSNMFDSYFK